MTDPTKSTPAKATKAAKPEATEDTPVNLEWRIQVNKEIDGDLWNIRARSAAEFLDIVRGLAEDGDMALDLFADFVQVVLARNVRTKGGGSSSSGGTSRAAEGPPSCKHGEMKDLASKGYRHRYYCSARNRSEQCPPQD